MIDLSSVTFSPYLSEQFNILRFVEGIQGPGGFIPGTSETIPVQGVVWPSTPKEVNMVPEGDRISGMMTFATAQQVFVTNPLGNADQIAYHGEKWIVSAVLDFSTFGFWGAVAKRMLGG